MEMRWCPIDALQHVGRNADRDEPAKQFAVVRPIRCQAIAQFTSRTEARSELSMDTPRGYGHARTTTPEKALAPDDSVH